MEKLITKFVTEKVYYLIGFLVLSASFAHAQMFYNSTGLGTTSNNLPFWATSTSKRVQFIVTPAMFNGASSGMINKIYFKSYYSSGPVATYTNFVVNLGNASGNPLSASAWDTAGMQTCITSPSFTISNIADGEWVAIPLQTPFYYDHTKNLIVDVSSTAVVNGFAISQRSQAMSPARAIGPVAAPALTDNFTPDFGFDVKTYNDAGVLSIDSPSLLSYGPGLQDVYATIKNYGFNQVTTADINWSVNGMIQPAYSWSGTLDTAGGSGSRIMSVNIGTFTFPNSTSIIKAWTSSPNSTADTMPLNDSTAVTRKILLSGSYTIDPTGSGSRNFTSFSAAVNALQQTGINAPVVFNVAAGTYNEQVNLVGPIAGVTLTNTITFDGGNGNAASRIITYAGTDLSYQTVQIKDVPYTTFRNLSIHATDDTYAFGVLISGASQGSRINNCRIILPANSDFSYSQAGIAIGDFPDYFQAGGRVDSLIIDSNTVTGGTYGISILSYMDPSLQNTFSNNTVTGFFAYGLYIGYQNGVVISNNLVESGLFGMSLSELNNNDANAVMITGNTVKNTGTPVMLGGSNTAGTKGLIANNAFGGGALTNINSCFSLDGSYWDVVNNTFNIDTVSTSSNYSCLNISSGSDITVMNNIFSVSKTGSLALPLYVSSAFSIDSMDYNIFYRKDTSDHKLMYLGGNFNSGNFTGAAGFNTHSFYADPSLISDVDFHVQHSCFKGQALPYVTHDIEGNLRPAPPVIGAYEYIASSNDLMVVQLTKPTVPAYTGAQDLEVMVRNTGSSTITSFTISYVLNGNTPVSQTVTNTLNPCDTMRVLFSGSQQASLGLGFNNIKLYSSLPNGSADNKSSNDTLQTGLYTALNGTYTINPSGSGPSNFTSFTSAVNALQGGVTGPVLFTVAPGIYNEQVNLSGPYGGVSSLNTITFDGGDGNAASRIISYKGTATAYQTVRISAVPFTTFRNLTIQGTDSTHSFGVLITGNSQRSRISNCIIRLPQNMESRNLAGIVIGGTTTSYNALMSRVDSLEIDSNLITGGYFGIADTSASAYSLQNKFRNNRLLNFYFTGMYFNKQSGLQLLNNTLMASPACSTKCVGMNLNNLNNNGTSQFMITGNKISNIGSSALSLLYSSGAAGRKALIANNMFGAASKSNLAALVSIQNFTSGGYLDIVNNTFHSDAITIDSTGGSLYIRYGIGYTIMNNIFSVKQTNNPALPLYIFTSTIDSMDYNIFYRQDTSNHRLIFVNNNVYNSGSFKGALGFNAHSVFAEPGFINDTNLHTPNTCLARGMSLSYITNDIDGMTRSIAPAIGASETPLVADNIAPVAIVSPTFPVTTGLQDMQVLVKNYGTTIVTSFTISYRLNGGPVNSKLWTGALSPCDTVTVSFDASLQVNIGNGINDIQVYTSNPGGNPDGNSLNDTLRKQLAKPMIGTYTIGMMPGDSFVSFNAAVAALQLRGVGGAVKFRVRSGTYNESILLNTISGTSAANTIEFSSMSDNRDSVIVNASGFFALTLSYSSYCSFKHITFNQQASTIGCISIFGNCDYDTMYSCKVSAPPFINNYYSSLVTANLPTNGTVLRKNFFYGGYFGIVLTTGQGCIIDSNTFADISNNNLNVQGHKIRNNTFNLTVAPSNGNPGTSIGISVADSTFEFSGNNVNVAANVVFSGCGMDHINGTSTNRVKVFNNRITLASQGTQFICTIGKVSNYIDVYNNIISLGSGRWDIGGAGTGQRYYNNSILGPGEATIWPGSNLEYKNNFSTMGITWYNNPGAETVDYNCYYGFWASNGVDTQLYSIGYGGIAITFATYRAMPVFNTQDRHTLLYLPVTDSATLAPAASDSSCWALNGRGIQASWNDKDINGNPRSTTVANGAPDIGAYEFTPASIPPAAIILDSAGAPSANPAPDKTQYFSFGENTIAKIKWNSTDVPSAISMRQYSGVNPPAMTTAEHMNVYWDIQAPAGPYNYDLTLYYNDPWIGTNSSKPDISIGQRVSNNPWTVYDSNSVIRTMNVPFFNILQVDSLSEFSLFTGMTGINTLPVKLLTFNAGRSQHDVVVRWSTASEINTRVFEIQRAFDGINFNAIGEIKANGHSTSLRSYQFIDKNSIDGKSAHTLYYRLKIIDADGSYNYSGIAVVNTKEQYMPEMTVYPNPSNGQFSIDNANGQTANATLSDITGKTIDTFPVPAGVTQLDYSMVKEGIYFLQVRTEKGRQTYKITVTK